VPHPACPNPLNNGKMKAAIYNDREKQKEIYLKKLQESGISGTDKKLILEFVKYKVEEDQIEIVRENKYLMHLRILGEHLKKPFNKASKDDIKQLLNTLYTKDIKRGETIKKLSESSKADYVIILKTFYKWLKKTENPEETAWIKPISVKKKNALRIMKQRVVLMLNAMKENGKIIFNKINYREEAG
jgi:site-specific recombinase XerD